MCGITGAVWTPQGIPIDQGTLDRMTDVLRHRGPDDRGTYMHSVHEPLAPHDWTAVALGMRRLSIIDRAGGHQPLSNEDGSVWIVFNGEIYNFQQLRRRLEGAGHRFRTRSDTEVIVHLYEQEGLDCFRHLNGMFALAIWDAERRQLVLARDRLGKKPLVYRHDPGRLVFASELKSILEVPGVPREIDVSALDEYLTYQYVPHPRTIFRGIQKLPPAHYAVYLEDTLTTHCYWQPDWQQEVNRPAADYADELRATLSSAVQMRLESEVPLGAFLSGGIDSSIVVGLMQQASREPVRTFSIGFPVKEYDETSYAAAVAERAGTNHHVFRVEPDGVKVLSKLVWFYDEPFADSSAIPTYYVSEATREHVTVALTGDGGDELFVGYPRYRAVELGAWFDRLPNWLGRGAANRLANWLPSSGRQKSPLRRARRLLEGLAMSAARRHLEWVTIFNEARRADLYTDELIERLPDTDPAQFLAQAFRRVSRRDPVTAASLVDLQTYLPCDLLTKVDIASMAHSLECRQPFLDYRVVELASTMPLALKYRRFNGKRILLKTFADLLPASVRRRSKMGFGVPLAHWLRHDLRQYSNDVLLDPQSLNRGYFRPEAVRRLVEEHQSGAFDHSARLWALLFFELWHRQWIG